MGEKHIHCATCGRRQTRSTLRTKAHTIFTTLQKQFFKISINAGHFCNECYRLFYHFCTGNITNMMTIRNQINSILKKRNCRPHTDLQLEAIRAKYKQNINIIESSNIQTSLTRPIIESQLPIQNDEIFPVGSLSTTYCIINSELLVKLCMQANYCSSCMEKYQIASISHKGIVTFIILCCNTCHTQMKFYTDSSDSNGAYPLNVRFTIGAHLGCLSYPSLKRFCLGAGIPCIGKTYFTNIGINTVFPAAFAKTSAQLLQNRNKFLKKYFKRFKLRICLFFHTNIPQDELQVYQASKQKGDAIWSLQRFYSYQCEEIIILIYSFLYPSIYISIAFDGGYPSKRHADYVRTITRETKLTKSILWRSYKVKQRTHDNDTTKFVGPSNMLEREALKQIFQQMKTISYCGLKLMVNTFCHDNDGKARCLIGQYFHSVPYVLDNEGRVLQKIVIDPSSLNIDPALQKFIYIPFVKPAEVPFFLREKYSIKIENYETNELVPANILFKDDWQSILFDFIVMKEKIDKGHSKKTLEEYAKKQCVGWSDKIVKAFTWAIYNCHSNAEELRKILVAFPRHWAKDHSYCTSMCSKDDTGKKRLNLLNTKDQKVYQALIDVMNVYASRADKFISTDSTNWNESINRSILVGCPKTIDYSKTGTNRVDMQLLRTQVGENYIQQILQEVGIDITEYDGSPQYLKKKYLSKLAYTHLHSRANANDESSYYHSERHRIVAEISENSRLNQEVKQIQFQQNMLQNFCTCKGSCKNRRCPCRNANKSCNPLCVLHTNCSNLQIHGNPTTN